MNDPKKEMARNMEDIERALREDPIVGSTLHPHSRGEDVPNTLGEAFGKHTISDQRQGVIRRIGDVTVTLDMPEGMAVPKVELLLHSRDGSLAERVAANSAFGMTDEDLCERFNFDSVWYTREEDGVEATVWFEREA